MPRPDPALLLYIRNHIEDNGYAPSVREMAAHLGKSVDTTQKRVKALVDAGLIERIGHRAIKIVYPEMFGVQEPVRIIGIRTDV